MSAIESLFIPETNFKKFSDVGIFSATPRLFLLRNRNQTIKIMKEEYEFYKERYIK